MIKGWNDVTIRVAEELERIEGETGIDRDVRTISLLSGIPEDEIWEWNVNKMGEALSGFAWILEPVVPVMTDCVEYQQVFRPVLDLGKMTYRQYADLNAAISSNDRAEIMASILAPVGGSYGKGYDMEGLKEHIRDTVSVPQYHGFFLNCLTSLLPQDGDLPRL